MDWEDAEAERRLELAPDQAKAEAEALVAAALAARSEWVDLRYRRIAALPSAISQMTWLKALDCRCTYVSDLSSLSGLPALALLDCGGTGVTDLSPLSGLPSLTSLDCCETPVSDLSPLRHCPSLKELLAYDLPNWPVPAEVLSQNFFDNCLPRLRSWYANQQQGSEPLRKHKLFLLGNGTVGKTQLARRLRGLEPDFGEPSTHGIQLHDCPLDAPPDARHPLAGDSFDARIWDFGGQDIYHGTHALFLKSRAIFLVCWDSASEDAREHVIDGVAYRNYPLAYWLDYVRSFAGSGAQVILVQTKTDMPGAALAPPVDLARYDDLAILEPCRTSALTGRGIANLKEAISEAVGRIEAPALQLIGISERKVADAIAARREAGERTLTQEQFAALCAEAGLAGAPEHLLHFLHHAGELFHADGLFGDRIIIDQRWALEAVYAVFERQECAPLIRAERGRFTLAMLGETVWRGYTADEQRHFLAMMLQCGMAFDYTEGGAGREETIYIAPDLLPDFDDPAVQRWFLRDWDPGDPGRESVIRVPLLHDGLIRALMVEIGRDAGLSAVYWKNGILFHDTRTRAVAMIAARWPDPEGWAGEIVITTQRSRAGELLAVLDAHVREVAEKLGLSLAEPSDAPGISDDFSRAGRPRGESAERTTFTPGPGEPRRPVCYVSYAWSDGSAQADANVALVDDLCADAEAHGITIIRDKTHLATGDTISGFTEEIARADKVAALIGARYWTRPDCFMELYGCWTESRSRPELFRAKVSEFPLADARLHDAGLLREIAEYWDTDFRRCDAMSAAHRDRHTALVAEFGDIWGRQSRQIIRAMQDKVRSYEGDFARFKQELFAEFDSLRYRPDHVHDT
jgi:internalin A